MADLRRLFGTRIEAVVAYGGRAPEWSHCMVLVSSLTMDDLTGLAAAVPKWHARGLATPLVMPREEFARSLDTFPVEYGEIIDTHEVLAGRDPFAGVILHPADLRRGLEHRAASHLLHVRENYIHSGGRPAAVTALVKDSAPGFETLLRRMARLDGTPVEGPGQLARWAAARTPLDARVVGDVLAVANEPSPAVDAVRLLPEYLQALETLLRVIDKWPVP